MKLTKVFVLLIFLFLGFSCSNAGNNGKTKVLISTSFGDIVVELYDETPQHRDNFIKLANEDFYDGQLFHRVIKNFMIQGGDPASKNAQPGQRLGGGDPGYTIPAEFNPKFFHKKGALSAARQPDQVNPEKRSSGSQFYLVQGEVYSNGQLDTLEMKINYNKKQQTYQKYFGTIQGDLAKLKQEGKQDEFNIKVAETRDKADSAFQLIPKVAIPADRRNIYTTLGGYPSLDGDYTVFGEVVEGLDVIDKIAVVETDKFNRPIQDVFIKKVEVIK